MKASQDGKPSARFGGDGDTHAKAGNFLEKSTPRKSQNSSGIACLGQSDCETSHRVTGRVFPRPATLGVMPKSLMPSLYLTLKRSVSHHRADLSPCGRQPESPQLESLTAMLHRRLRPGKSLCPVAGKAVFPGGLPPKRSSAGLG